MVERERPISTQKCESPQDGTKMPLSLNRDEYLYISAGRVKQDFQS